MARTGSAHVQVGDETYDEVKERAAQLNERAAQLVADNSWLRKEAASARQMMQGLDDCLDAHELSANDRVMVEHLQQAALELLDGERPQVRVSMLSKDGEVRFRWRVRTQNVPCMQCLPSWQL